MINVTALKQQIKKGIIKNLYLFCGEEAYLIDSYTKKITDSALGDGLREFNYTFYNEDNENFELFKNDVEAYPVMSEKKVIVLKNVSFIKLKDYQKPVAEILGNVPPYAVVIIIDTDGAKMKKPVTDAISANGEIVDFKKQSAADLRSWLSIKLGRYGKEIQNPDADYLVNLCGRSLEKLAVEAEKLASSTDGRLITRELINTLVKIPVEYKIFEMSDCLLKGDSAGAYGILGGFKTAKVQPIVIFSVIYGQLSDLLMFRLVGDEGGNPSEFLAPNKKWLASKMSAECRRYSKEKLRNGMRLCAGYDLEVKKGNIDGYAAVEIMMAELLK